MARLLNRLPNKIEGTSFDPNSRFGKSPSEKIGDLLNFIEGARGKNADRKLVDETLKGGQETQPKDSSLLGVLKGIIDPTNAPQEPTDFEKKTAGNLLSRQRTGNKDFDILKESFRQVGKEMGIDGKTPLTTEQRRELQKRVVQRAKELQTGTFDPIAGEPEQVNQPQGQGILGGILNKGKEVLGNVGTNALEHLRGQGVSAPATRSGGASKVKKGISQLLDFLEESEPPKKGVDINVSGNSVPNFNSVQEAEQANLPPGTEITINGRRAIIE